MKVMANGKMEEVLMVLKFRKLDIARCDKRGYGIAVITSTDYCGEREYDLIAIEDRTVMDSASEFGDDAQYIYETLPLYPYGVALTHQFTKYLDIGMSDDIETLINAYNLTQLGMHGSYEDEPWGSMNKTQFKKFLKTKGTK